jgi:hypothetical protein
MKKGILFAIFCSLLLLGFMGCHKKSQQVELLSRDSMIEILADVHIAESALRTNAGGTADQFNARRNAYFEWVMKYHHTSYAQFDFSVKHYLENSDRFSKMYDEVISRIKQKEMLNKSVPAKAKTPVKPPIKTPKQKIDSIKKVNHLKE